MKEDGGTTRTEHFNEALLWGGYSESLRKNSCNFYPSVMYLRVLSTAPFAGIVDRVRGI